MTPLMNYHLHQNIQKASIAGVCFGSGDMRTLGLIFGTISMSIFSGCSLRLYQWERPTKESRDVWGLCR